MLIGESDCQVCYDTEITIAIFCCPEDGFDANKSILADSMRFFLAKDKHDNKNGFPGHFCLLLVVAGFDFGCGCLCDSATVVALAASAETTQN